MCRLPDGCRTDPLFPDTALFRSVVMPCAGPSAWPATAARKSSIRPSPFRQRGGRGAGGGIGIGAGALQLIDDLGGGVGGDALDLAHRLRAGGAERQIGRASCRERVCQYV